MIFLKQFFGAIAIFAVTVWTAFEQYVFQSDQWF